MIDVEIDFEVSFRTLLRLHERPWNSDIHSQSVKVFFDQSSYCSLGLLKSPPNCGNPFNRRVGLEEYGQLLDGLPRAQMPLRHSVNSTYAESLGDLWIVSVSGVYIQLL
jgi:hypothetical protein